MFNTELAMTKRPPPPPPLNHHTPSTPPEPATVVSTPRQRRAERKGPAKAARATRKANRKVATKADKARLKVERAQVKEQLKSEPKAPRERIRPFYQFGLLARSAHPIQALVMTIAIGTVAGFDHRGVGGTAVAAGGVLLTQLALGLLNDAYDEKSDARGDRRGKPVAAGALPKGNASYIAMILALASIPVAALNGTVAGAALLLTLPIGFLHNRILHRTPASFLGWMITFPLLATYIAYGGWGAGKHGDAPTWQILVATAALGLTCHFLTALPDLASDHKAGLTELPLVIARRTGATVLLIITVVCLIAAIAVTVWCGLHFGLRQR